MTSLPTDPRDTEDRGSGLETPPAPLGVTEPTRPSSPGTNRIGDRGSKTNLRRSGTDRTIDTMTESARLRHPMTGFGRETALGLTPETRPSDR